MEEKWSARMIREEIVSALRLPPRVVIVSYGRFGTTYLSHPQVSRIQKKKKAGDSRTLMVEPTGCPRTSVRNYQYFLRSNQEEQCSQEIINSEVARGVCAVGKGKFRNSGAILPHCNKSFL